MSTIRGCCLVEIRAPGVTGASGTIIFPITRSCQEIVENLVNSRVCTYEEGCVTPSHLVTFVGTATASPGGSTVTITRRLEPRYGDTCPPGQRVVDCGENIGDLARETIISNAVVTVDSVTIAPGSQDEFLACLICLRCFTQPIYEVIEEVEASYLENLREKLDQDLGGGGEGQESQSGRPVGMCIC
jgi:hypothetical protein